MQKAEKVHHSGQGEVKRTQAENGKRIGGKNNKLFAGDGQNGRHTVNRKNQIGNFNHHQHNKKKSGNILSVFLNEKLIAMEFV